MDAAEREILEAMENIERERKQAGISMRALSTKAGLRPTSYWGIVRSKKNMKAVKATTLAALGYALGMLP